jgi:hypothetical protein
MSELLRSQERVQQVGANPGANQKQRRIIRGHRCLLPQSLAGLYVSDGHHHEKHGGRNKNQIKHGDILSLRRLLGCLILIGRPSYGPNSLAAAETKFACPGARAVLASRLPDAALQLPLLSLAAAALRRPARGLRF